MLLPAQKQIVRKYSQDLKWLKGYSGKYTMRFNEFTSESVAGPKNCWPGYKKTGTQPGTGKNAGKRVNDCEKIKEFAPPGGDGREPNEEEILRQLAAQWWLGTEQQMAKAQRTLEVMGWEIGQDESGDDDAGVFLIRPGDEHGDTYIAFNHSDLEGLNEAANAAQQAAIAIAKKKEPGVVEAKGLAKKVKVVKGEHAGKTGWIREIKHGAFKGAPKTYYIDLDDGGQANNLPATALRLVKAVDEASLATMRDFFAGDKNADDPTASAQQRNYFSKNDNSKPAVAKKFRSKQEYEQWLAQQKNKKAFKVTEEELDEGWKSKLAGAALAGAAAFGGGAHAGGLSLPPAGLSPAQSQEFAADQQAKQQAINNQVSDQQAGKINYNEPGPITKSSLGQKLEYGIPVDNKGNFIAPDQNLPDDEYLTQLKAYKAWLKDFTTRWPNAQKRPDGTWSPVKPGLAPMYPKESVTEGVIIGPSESNDPMDPQVAVLGGAGSYSLKGLYNKAQRESAQLTKDIGLGNFRSSSHNVKQLANTLNTIVAAHNELEAIRKGGGAKSRGIERGVDYKE
jgi:hypothetical protein